MEPGAVSKIYMVATLKSSLSMGGMALEHPLKWSFFLENQCLSNRLLGMA